MTVYCDENIPKHLAHGFQIMQNPENLKEGREQISVIHLLDKFDRGIKDLEWIPLLEPKDIVITRDIHLSRRKSEIAAYKEQNIGLFFLRGANSKDQLSTWEMAEILIRRWEEMVTIILETEYPFACKLRATGKINFLK